MARPSRLLVQLLQHCLNPARLRAKEFERIVETIQPDSIGFRDSPTDSTAAATQQVLGKVQDLGNRTKRSDDIGHGRPP